MGDVSDDPVDVEELHMRVWQLQEKAREIHHILRDRYAEQGYRVEALRDELVECESQVEDLQEELAEAREEVRRLEQDVVVLADEE